MGSHLIEYACEGDEAVWRHTIETFLAAVADDPVLRDGYSCHVFVRPDGRGRAHVPVWRDRAELDRLRSRPFFKTFTDKVSERAGDTLLVTRPELGG